YKHDAIVLGAYGCGVFRNSPTDVASHFKKAILDNEIFIKGYKKILFAVFDRSEHKNTIKEFERVFSK
ncbi:MAG TPA: TIGR02452 family protein, partial [Clostridia bacterium]